MIPKEKQPQKHPVPTGFEWGHLDAEASLQSYEDQGVFKTLTTAGGLELSLILVADGQGKMKDAQSPAQFITDLILETCKNSPEKNIPQLLGKAIGAANRTLFQETQKQAPEHPIFSTVAIAAIHEGCFFVANVGHSRVYLLRDGEITQVTRDHTWINEQMRKGLPVQTILSHPKAKKNSLTRALGLEPKVQVDLGLYMDSFESGQEAYRNQGMLLHEDDQILVCSDGLSKTPAGSRTPYLPEEEMAAIMRDAQPEQAAKSLVRLVEDRGVDDHVTVILASLPSRKIKRSVLQRAKVTPLITVIVSFVLLLGGFGIWRLLSTQKEIAPPSGNAYVRRVSDDTVKFAPATVPQPVQKGELIPFGSGSLIQVREGLTELTLPGFIFLQASGIDTQTEIELFKSSLADPPEYPTVIKLIDGKILISGQPNTDYGSGFYVNTPSGKAVVKGTVMGVQYNAEQQVLIVDCMEGHCLLDAPCKQIPLQAGQHAWVDAGCNPGQHDYIDYSDYQGFNLPAFLATDTPLPDDPTSTSIPPTNTPVPTRELIPTPSLLPWTSTPTADSGYSNDLDGDGVLNQYDNCPQEPNDDYGNPCNHDDDGDGKPDENDPCFKDPHKVDPGICGCGVPDNDTDGDGVEDCIDLCPDDPGKTEPGVCGCNAVDEDLDNDGYYGCDDNCPRDPLKQAEGICGCGIADDDTDGDGTADCNDGCPNDPNKISPGTGGCGTPDTDSDGDGTPDCNDGCPNDPNKISPGTCGCGTSDTDSDNDGTPDCNDDCDSDPNKIATGDCGCGVADTDGDGDGTADCNDGCPSDANKTSEGTCGCGKADTDSDGDGTADCNDDCDSDPNKTSPGTCGCGTPDYDSDGDGTPDCNDNFPNDPSKSNLDNGSRFPYAFLQFIRSLFSKWV